MVRSNSPSRSPSNQSLLAASVGFRRIRPRVTNASYFAFTATPKNKTLEMFGEPLPRDGEGKVKHRPFHRYTMKQAVEDRFILDVLTNYTPTVRQ
jgi:type I site-specific restriction-modification system R (restriction) subunit